MNNIGTIIALVLGVILVAAVFIGVLYARNKIREFSRFAFGTDSLIEGLKKTEREYENTPKSVAGATKLYMPQIMRDFPEFHLEEMRERAENVLRSYLYSIDQENSSHLTEGTDELRAELDTEIAMRRSEDTRERFESIKIHKTEIFKYNKQKGRVSIVFQSAVGFINYVERNGKVIKGKKDRFTQARYNVEVSYIQDREYIAETGMDGHSLTCPNCGAPITGLGGDRICKYCGTAVTEVFNINVWMFTGVKVVK
jgi:hypothetical protein